MDLQESLWPHKELAVRALSLLDRSISVEFMTFHTMNKDPINLHDSFTLVEKLKLKNICDVICFLLNKSPENFNILSLIVEKRCIPSEILHFNIHAISEKRVNSVRQIMLSCCSSDFLVNNQLSTPSHYLYQWVFQIFT